MKTKSKRSAALGRFRKAVTEIKQVQRGQRAPSRAFKVLPDGKGGFIRGMLDPEQARQRHAEKYANTVVTARASLNPKSEVRKTSF